MTARWIALDAKDSLSDCTTICSFACEPEARLASGVPIVEAFSKLRAGGVRIRGRQLHKTDRDGAIAPADSHRWIARGLPERRISEIYRRPVYLSCCAGLFRPSSAGNGRRRCAVDRRLLRDKSPHNRSDFEGDRTQAREIESPPCCRGSARSLRKRSPQLPKKVCSTRFLPGNA